MRDVLRALEGDGPVVTATVVGMSGSAPRPPGAKLAVAHDGAVTGAVSGGCVEAAIVQSAEQVLAGAPDHLVRFGIADDEAWDVGLPCGGELEVWIASARTEAATGLARLVAQDGRGALVTRLDDARALLVRADGGTMGDLGDPALEAHAIDVASELMWAERSERRTGPEGVPLFVDVVYPSPRLFVVGAVDVAAHLCALARVSGWRPFVLDPRSRFATRERFPAAEQVVARWPVPAFDELGGLDRSSAVAVVTHDPKVDDAALVPALRSDAGYVGAMGSRRTQARRAERLRALGVTEHELGRLAAPIGLDLGGSSPQETALSIMAEVVAARHGRRGGRLADAHGPIHAALG